MKSYFIAAILCTGLLGACAQEEDQVEDTTEQPATARLPPQEVEITYYRDASKTEIVGGKLIVCAFTGGYEWGQKTQFKTIFTSPCGTPGNQD